MRYIELLASYLPTIIVEELIKNPDDFKVPHRATYETSCLFADVSGFTALSEAMSAKHGPHVGAEYLAKHLNSYFAQIVKIIGSEGGDVFKFAGDAMIVLWPPSDDEDIANRSRRAAQCAIRIQQLGQEIRFGEDTTLSIKIGIGVGSLSVLQIGGVLNRKEYVAVGEPMIQAFAAEACAKPGDVVLSTQVWERICDHFKAITIEAEDQKFYNLDIEHRGNTLRKRNKHYFGNVLDSCSEFHEMEMRNLIPHAALQSIDAEHPEFENYSSELRRVSVLFISFGFTEHDLLAAAKRDQEMMRIHTALKIAQAAVYKYEGALNKFLMDDKGATLIAVFGLPPYSHENDPKRAVSCSLHLVDTLRNGIALESSVGATTGVAFCGVLGSQTRKEYSVLGDIVNLSARLMVASKKAGPCQVYCDAATYQASYRDIPYQNIGTIKVKGKEQAIETFQALSAKQKKGNIRTGASMKITRDLLDIQTPSRKKIRTPGLGARRFDTIDVLTSERTSCLDRSDLRKESLSVYFRNGSIPSATREVVNSTRRLNSRAKTANALDTAPTPKTTKGGFRLMRFHSGTTKKSKSDAARSQTDQSKGRLSSRIAQLFATYDTNSTDLEEFAFDIQSISKNSKNPKSTKSVSGSTISSKRDSFTFYDTTASLIDDTTQEATRALEESIFMQVAVGYPSICKIGGFERDSFKDSTKIVTSALGSAKRDHIIREPVQEEDICLVIQGTEIALPTKLFPSFQEQFKSRKGGGAHRGLPLQYLESFVTEALSHGEIRDFRGLRESLYAQNGTDKKKPKRSSSTAADENYSGNGGTSLKLVMIPADDVPTIQSSGAAIRQKLMQNKIELLEYSKGSVTVISGAAGSGKTHILKRLKLGFLPGTVPVFTSSEKWDHTTSQFENSRPQAAASVDDEESDEEDAESTGNKPFRNESYTFSPWFDIINRWIHHESKTSKRGGGHKSIKFRTDFIKDALGASLMPYASLLNDNLDTHFIEPVGASAQALDALNGKDHAEQVNKTTESMIVAIVSYMARKYDGMILIFDDALRFDSHSWRVSRKLSQLIGDDEIPLMMVFATRPFDGLVNRSFGLNPSLISMKTRSALTAYRSLCKVKAVDFVQLGPLSAFRARELFKKCVGSNIEKITLDLWKLCEDRCYNNPLLIKEFAYEIRHARCPKIVLYTPFGGKGGNKKQQNSPSNGGTDKKKYIASLRVTVQSLDEPAWVVHAADKAAASKQEACLSSSKSSEDQSKRGSRESDADIDLGKLTPDCFAPCQVPPPATVVGALGSRFDRLEPMEQLVLKIACVIGSMFSLRLVEDVYPSQQEGVRAEIQAACESLANQHGILHKIRANAYNDEYVYRCADILLVSTVRNRLLTKQRLALAANISRARTQYKAALSLQNEARISKRSIMRIESLGPENNFLKEGYLNIRKSDGYTFTSLWKERYVILRKDVLLVFRTKNPKKVKETDAQEAIFLNQATVTVCEEKGQPAFLVESGEWVRKGDHHYSTKTFIFSPPNGDEDEVSRWVSKIRMAVNKMKLGLLLRNGVQSSSNNFLPIRQRNLKDFKSVLRRDETAMIVSLHGIVTPTPVVTKGLLYASMALKINQAPQIVRKQTLLGPIESEGYVKINETFAFSLEAENLMDWSSVTKSIDRNTYLEIVLWAQRDGSIDCDQMLGQVNVYVADLYEEFQDKNGLRKDLNIFSPYSGEQKPLVLSLTVDMNVSEDDRQRLVSFSAPSRTPEATMGMQVYHQNQELVLREIEHRANSRRPSNASDTRASARGKKQQRSLLRMAAFNGHKGSGVSVDSASLQSRGISTTVSNASSISNTPPYSSDHISLNPVDATLCHIDYLLHSLEQTAAQPSKKKEDKETSNEKWIQEQLEHLKQLLLTQSFATLVNNVDLDENSRLWLGKEFTREPTFSDDIRDTGDVSRKGSTSNDSGPGSSSAVRSSKATHSRSRGGSLELYTEAYLKSSRRQLSYLDEEGVFLGPYPLSFYTNRLIRGQIDESVIVKLHSIPEETESKREDEDTLMELGKYLSQMEAQAVDAAATVTKWSSRGSRASTEDRPGVDKPNLQEKLSSPTNRLVATNSHPYHGVKGTVNPMSIKNLSWEALEGQFQMLSKELEKDLSDAKTGDINEWTFDLKHVPTQYRGPMLAQMYRTFQLDERFSIPVEKFYMFTEKIHTAMSLFDAPYHNFNHACDVIQATYVLLGRMRGSELLDDVEILGLLTAALCHDLEHPALNNAYQVKAKTELALVYNDRSVLESHHCACTFSLFRDAESNIICNLDEREYEKMRQVVIETILATDMTCHFGLTGELRNCIVRNFDDESITEIENLDVKMNSQDRLVVAKTFLHCADISNPSRSWEVTKAWQKLVMEEFFNQGDLEKENGWKVSPNMDRETTRIEELSLNFIDFIVAPLLFALYNLLPGVKEPCLLLAFNRKKWMQLLEQDIQERVNIDKKEKEQLFEQWSVRNAAFEEITHSAGLYIERSTKSKRRNSSRRSFTSPSKRHSFSQDSGTKSRHSTGSTYGHARKGSLSVLQSYVEEVSIRNHTKDK